uniref:interleukin 15, like isoform X2 n=1 Tax=Scatophagus argus TaxID=75038 RepID=UPI001ED8579F|nr:interleukin 15, like isoform X2 [Scatophagus argus]
MMFCCLAMLRGRLTLASVCLYLVCPLGLRLQPAAKLYTEDVIRRVESLIVSDLTELDCRLYTPTIEDYQKCPSSTMKCFADEVKVLIEEWENFPAGGLRLNIKLKKLAKLLNKTEASECLQCELSKEEKAEKFLKDLALTLRTMNFQHS